MCFNNTLFIKTDWWAGYGQKPVICQPLFHKRVFQVALVVNNLPANADVRDMGSVPWVGKIPCRRKWQPTPVFLPRESPGTEELGGLWFIGSRRVGLKQLSIHAFQGNVSLTYSYFCVHY